MYISRHFLYKIKIMLEKFRNEIINETKYFRNFFKIYDMYVHVKGNTYTYIYTDYKIL